MVEEAEETFVLSNNTFLTSLAIRGREILNAIEAAEKVGSSIVFADVTDMVCIIFSRSESCKTVRDRIANELETDERYKGRGIDPNMVCNCLAFGMGTTTAASSHSQC